MISIINYMLDNSRMRVRIRRTSPDLGGRRGDERYKHKRRVGSGQSQVPTWSGMAPQEEPRVRTVEGTEGRGNTKQGKEPLKATSRREQATSIEESNVVRNFYLFGSMQVKTRGGGKVVHESMEQEGEQSRV